MTALLNRLLDTRRPLLLIAFVVGLGTLPAFFSLPPSDRDESRFAQATKQMLESGDPISIRFQDEARNKKPVGIYWLQAAAVRLGETLGVPDARRQIWLYRVPSQLGATAAVLLTYWAGLILLRRPEAFAAALLFGAGILIGVEARLAKTDAVLCATAAAAFAVLARLWVLRQTVPIRPSETFAFWIVMAISFLIKGPMVLLFAGLAMIVLSICEKSGAWLKPLADWRAILLALLIVLPWFVAITLKTQGGFFVESVRDDLLGKVGAGQETHGAPPGLYALIFPFTFWPGSAFLLLALPWLWKNRRDDIVLVCLAWIIPTWLMFEAITTKLPHYVLPVYPAVAILTVKALSDGGAFIRRGWRAAVTALPPLIPLLLAAAVLFAVGSLEPGGLERFLPLVWAAPLWLLAIALAFGLVALLGRGAGVAAIPVAAAASLALAWSVYHSAWAGLRSLQISPRLAEAVAASGCADPRVASIGGYNEPSLVFLTRSDLAMLSGAGGGAWLAGEGCRVALVESREEKAFLDAAQGGGLTPRLLTRVGGVNINRAFERDSLTPRRLDFGVYLRDTSRP